MILPTERGTNREHFATSETKRPSDILWEQFKPCITYLPETQQNFVSGVFSTAFSGHRLQRRKSGEPYIIHPIAVASILAEARLGHETIAAALLHDISEDSDYIREAVMPETYNDDFVRIASAYSPRVAHMIDIVTEREELPIYVTRIEQALEDEPGAVFIKLADRIHNIETLASMPIEKQRKKIRETELLYMLIFEELAKKYSVQAEPLLKRLNDALAAWKKDNPNYTSPSRKKQKRARNKRLKRYQEYIKSPPDPARRTVCSKAYYDFTAQDEDERAS